MIQPAYTGLTNRSTDIQKMYTKNTAFDFIIKIPLLQTGAVAILPQKFKSEVKQPPPPPKKKKKKKKTVGTDAQYTQYIYSLAKSIVTLACAYGCSVENIQSLHKVLF